MKKLFLIVSSFLTLCVGSAEATTYYASTTGSGSACTSASPCTPETLISKAVPGDTLIIQNGTYNQTTGITIDCNVNASNGTEESRVMLKAETERQAYLKPAHDSVDINLIEIFNCSHWNVEGLRIEQPGSHALNGFGMLVYQSSNITIKRNLFNDGDQHLLYVSGSSAVTIEENEFYRFSAQAITLNGGVGGHKVRRNYCNRRGEPALAIQGCLVVYPGSGNYIENNISELSGTFLSTAPLGTTEENFIYGNISLADENPLVLQVRDHRTTNTTIKDLLVVNPVWNVAFRAAVDTVASHISVFMTDNSSAGITADNDFADGVTGLPSATLSNSFVTGASYGVYFRGQNTFSISHIGTYNNTYDFGDQAITNSNHVAVASDVFGSCRVFVPDGTALKEAGSGRADIGANILYAYIDGELQDGTDGKQKLKLWNTADGAWLLKGAVIAGVNDTNSIQDIERRLHSGCTGTAWPAAY